MMLLDWIYALLTTARELAGLLALSLDPPRS